MSSPSCSARGYVRVLAWACLLVLPSCHASCHVGRSANVDVTCEGAGDHYDCLVRHLSGTSRAHACWKLVASCSNNLQVEASACQDVDPGRAEHHLIPFREFTHAAQCENMSGTALKDLQVTVP